MGMSSLEETYPMVTKLKLTDWLLKVKYLDYVKPSAANGTVRAIYAQADREFGLAADPIVVHSPLPALLGAFWEFGRETRLVRECVAAHIASWRGGDPEVAHGPVRTRRGAGPAGVTGGDRAASDRR